ncbi:hypothetical protein H5410_038521 [Solanum commersonii]|uniref:non-specific serine/threonine protein kinase n=1 Tax=Solanum commersonii TaxID=4109 RepID=A0A9J5YAC3_SOLCO|nr:hypothetical protein H5410_038521 [Solanum commersonii]
MLCTFPGKKWLLELSTIYDKLVWSANRDHPVKANATLQLSRDGNLVLEDSDEFSFRAEAHSKHFRNQSDSRFAWFNYSQWKLGHLHLTSIPIHLIFTMLQVMMIFGQTLTALQDSPTSPPQFMKLGHDGHLRVYQWDENVFNWKDTSNFLSNSTVGTQWCAEDTAFVQMMDNIVVQLKYDSLVKIKNTTYFELISNQDGSRRGSCLLLNEVFSLINNDNEVDTAVFLKVQNSSNAPVISPRQKTKSFKATIGSTFAALLGLILVLSACSLLYGRRIGSINDVDFLDLAPISPGILTRFSYNEFKITTQDFCRKLGEGRFGSVYEGTLSNGTKIAVKHLDGVDQDFNRDHPVKANATLQLGLDGNLVLADSDGTFVWSTNTTGKSVSGLSMTETGNLVLFDKANHTIWQSFDHPTDCLLPGQSLVSGRKLIASISETNQSQEDFSRKLREGGFGSVYEGTLTNGTKIAVKRLDGLGHVMESFLTEVKIVDCIHQVNLVKLIGFCAKKSQRLLIYEHMVNGSLDRWIYHKNQENGLTWHTRQRIITGIAKGLAYLHDECNQKIIHMDIKPQNILLDQNVNAKISDFGLSKLIEKDKSKIVTRMRGTPGYLAPEWLR